MSNGKPSTCPNCGGEIGDPRRVCLDCGTDVSGERRRLEDAEYLAKDSWSFPKEPAPSSTWKDVAKVTPVVTKEQAAAQAAAVAMAQKQSLGGWQQLDADSRLLFRGMLLGGLIAMLLWFIPNYVGESVHFPFNELASTHGMALVGLLLGPMVGVIVTGALIAPISYPLKASVGMVAAGGMLLWLEFRSEQLLILQGGLALAIACFATLLSVVCFLLISRDWVGQVVVAVFPLVLLGTISVGAVTGRVLWGQLVPFKAPLELYSAMLILSSTVGYLLRIRLKNRANR